MSTMNRLGTTARVGPTTNRRTAGVKPELGAEPLPQLTELSPQERRIVALISQEYQTKEVARELGISSETVKTHLRRVYAKLGVHSRAGLVARAYTRFQD